MKSPTPSEERPVRVAVIGVGHLGKHHARLLRAIPQATLVGVCDVSEDTARDVGTEWGVPWATDPLDAPMRWEAEAVSVVVPTTHHADLAIRYLEHGLDVLVEKPITRTIEEAELLCKAAEANSRILQVGHVERFNPVVKALQELGIEPRYIESERHAPFSFRSTDIGVTLDLMIHDLDLVLWLTGRPILDVEAYGGALFTPNEDIVSARLRFDNGVVARLSANRVALRPHRRMRMFSRDSYVSLDFGKQYGLIVQKQTGWDIRELDIDNIDTDNIQNLWKFVFDGLLKVRELKMDEHNPLEEELKSFLDCVRTRRHPIVDGRVGLKALRAAHRVIDAAKENEW
jgi:predicted dehydrogenase